VPIALAPFIAEMIGMISQRAAVHGIALHHSLQEGTVSVEADPAQLQQVILNLFNNAIDAIIDQHGNNGGELAIATRRTDGGGVEIRIRDNGCGIQTENIEKIFAPFFTTKPVGKGTGLGLSVCYGIIKGIGGQMKVDSTPGAGTVFSINLPVAA
jgi:two-component system NtrC family sensor kinase